MRAKQHTSARRLAVRHSPLELFTDEWRRALIRTAMAEGRRIIDPRAGRNSNYRRALPCERKTLTNATVDGTQIKIDGYFEALYRRLPVSFSKFIRWLRQPSSFAARFAVAILFVVGGLFSFLPILGIWMLPLGLLLIAQDVPALQKPIVSALMWTEAKWKALKAKRQSSS